MADRKVKGYSQGMRQRLGLAAALMRQPSLLLLDEPANGLDPAGIAEFRGLLRSLADGGTTVFLSSHLLAEVEQVCDQVAVIQSGRLVEQGPARAAPAGAGWWWHRPSRQPRWRCWPGGRPGRRARTACWSRPPMAGR